VVAQSRDVLPSPRRAPRRTCPRSHPPRFGDGLEHRLHQGHNVWLTSPDGSRQRQVTTDGTASRAYNWPSQADDGTILAKYGDLFVRLRPDGTKLGEPIPAVGSDIRHSGSMTVMAGPAEPKISPDGSRFAYWISARNLDTCPIWTPAAPTRTPIWRSSAASIASPTRLSSAAYAPTAIRRGSATTACSCSTTGSVSRRPRSRPSAPASPGCSSGSTRRRESRRSAPAR
jgi:hypothetical protein